LVDDHDLVRTGLRSILDSATDIDVVGDVSCGEDAVAWVRKDAPDVILMDLNMPGMGGIEATRKINQINDKVKVIALTVHTDDPFPSQFHKAGAIGYLTKGCQSEELFEGIRTVAAGHPYISKEVAQKMTLANMMRGGKQSPLEQLSNREMQVMMMITKGVGNQQISDTLCLSPKTISTYRHRLFEKLDVTNDVELTHFAIRQGIISNGDSE
jgi:two-component system invasion response regulator UvrY